MTVEKAIKKTKPQTCPKCGSENILYLDSDLDDEWMSYDCTCSDCGAEFKELYKLNYDGFLYNGIDYDANGERYKWGNCNG